MHINEQMNALGSYLPPIYIATSIQDFLKERDQTHVWDGLKSSLYFSRVKGGSLVIIHNIDLFRVGESEYQLRDMTASFNVINEGRKESVLPENLNNGRYHKISLKHYPKADVTYLIGVKKFGSPQGIVQGNSLEGLLNSLR